MPRDSAPFGPAKPTNCHLLEAPVLARFPDDANRIAHRVIVVAHWAVRAALADGVPGLGGIWQTAGWHGTDPDGDLRGVGFGNPDRATE